MVSNEAKYGPTPSISCNTNLLMMVMKNPVSMEAIAARSVKRGQNRDRIIIGQKVAAMPAQPKITNQKIVRSGDSIETTTATPSAQTASTIVTRRHIQAA